MRIASLTGERERDLEKIVRRGIDERGIDAPCWKGLQKLIRRGRWAEKINENFENKI